MSGSYTRTLSPFEKIYLAKADGGQHFTNQGIAVGTGKIHLEQWEKAVQAASVANLGSRVILKRRGLKQHWVPGGAMPRVRLIRDCDWDGQSSRGIPYLPDGLCPVSGPVCEVVLLQGRGKVFAVFNTLHAAMDGMGTVAWTKDIFRALRGEQPVGYNGTATELQVAAGYRGTPQSGLDAGCISPFPRTPSEEPGGIWVRKQIPQLVPRVIPRLCHAAASHSLRHGTGKVRFMVPVNLRRRGENLDSTGNLTGNLFLDVEPGGSERSIHLQLLKKLKNHQDCHFPFAMKLVQYLPARMLHQSLRDQDLKAGRSGLYPFTGVITHLGRLDAADLTGEGFIADGWFSINSMSGPGLPPLFITISEFGSAKGNETNLVIGARRAQASHDDLEELAGEILKAALSAS